MSGTEGEPGKWLTVFIDQNGDGSDFNDSDEVLGWLGATLTPTYAVPGEFTLTVTHEADVHGGINVETTERYRVIPEDGAT